MQFERWQLERLGKELGYHVTPTPARLRSIADRLYSALNTAIPAYNFKVGDIVTRASDVMSIHKISKIDSDGSLWGDGSHYLGIMSMRPATEAEIAVYREWMKCSHAD